jgi:signal transduction histidine kinase
MKRLLLPVPFVGICLLCGLVAAMACVQTATRQPWLGVTLAADAGPGLAITAVAPDGPLAEVARGGRLLALSDGLRRIALEAVDIIEEPDILPTYDDLNRFRARQDSLRAMLATGPVELELIEAGGALRRLAVRPGALRPVSDLPPAFWLQIGVGLVGLIAGVWVFAMRRGGPEAGLLLLSGVGLLGSACAASVYSTRELALAAPVLRGLAFANSFAAMMFGVGMLGLFMIYPVRLLPARAVLLCAALLLPPMLNTFELAGVPWLGTQVPMLVNLGLIALFVGLQRRATRGDAVARARLQWLGLSVLIGAGVFVLMIIAPPLLGAAMPLSQSLAFLSFVFVYAGLALGVVRYRLLDLESWSVRVLFYLTSLALIFAIDAALLTWLSFAPLQGLEGAIVAVLALYLPLRDGVARRILARNAPIAAPEAWFDRLGDVALSPSRPEQVRKWRDLLNEIFAPLGLTDLQAGPERPQVLGDGKTLVVPAVAGLPAVQLDWKSGGRRLFSTADMRTLGTMTRILDSLAQNRDAFARGVLDERARISRDMHDNIGIQLLGALHAGAVEKKNALVRAALADLRLIVSDARQQNRTLEAMLAELRREVSELLASCEIALDWRLDLQPGPPPAPAVTAALQAVIREATSNILHHARAGRVTVAIDLGPEALRFCIEDDGIGIATARAPGGSGIANLTERLAALGGGIEVTARTPLDQGTRVSGGIPVLRAASAVQP